MQCNIDQIISNIVQQCTTQYNYFSVWLVPLWRTENLALLLLCGEIVLVKLVYAHISMPFLLVTASLCLSHVQSAESAQGQTSDVWNDSWIEEIEARKSLREWRDFILLLLRQTGYPHENLNSKNVVRKWRKDMSALVRLMEILRLWHFLNCSFDFGEGVDPLVIVSHCESWIFGRSPFIALVATLQFEW